MKHRVALLPEKENQLNHHLTFTHNDHLSHNDRDLN